jgi:hypothetical protein
MSECSLSLLNDKSGHRNWTMGVSRYCLILNFRVQIGYKRHTRREKYRPIFNKNNEFVTQSPSQNESFNKTITLKNRFRTNLKINELLSNDAFRREKVGLYSNSFRRIFCWRKSFNCLTLINQLILQMTYQEIHSREKEQQKRTNLIQRWGIETFQEQIRLTIIIAPNGEAALNNFWTPQKPSNYSRIISNEIIDYCQKSNAFFNINRKTFLF